MGRPDLDLAGLAATSMGALAGAMQRGQANPAAPSPERVSNTAGCHCGRKAGQAASLA
jgi:hypothetical protein